MAERLERGFAATGASPPRSDKGFTWPTRKELTDAQREAFVKTLSQLTRAKGLNHRELARAVNGETRDDKGYVIPRSAGTFLNYIGGNAFPSEEMASVLAAFFKVPMQRLLQDDGQPFEPLALIRPQRATPDTRRKMNGHARKGNGAAGPGIVSHGAPAPVASEPAPLKPPKGVKPIAVEIKTLPGFPDWCHVWISGSVPLDVALGVVAFIERGTHRAPRK